MTKNHRSSKEGASLLVHSSKGGKVIGYTRVSSAEQNPERQLDGIDLDKVFQDVASGKNTARPELENLLSYVREGDHVVVHSMDRLARNLDDLRRLVTTLTSQNITVQFIKENLIFSGEAAPLSKLMLSVMGAFAEFERALIRERQMEGIALAKKRGVYKGRKPCLTPDQILLIKSRILDGDKKTAIAREFGVSRETVYKALRS